MEQKVIYWTVVYLLCGLAMFFIDWKEIERKDPDFKKKSRKERIFIRIINIIIWPVPFVMSLAYLIWRVFRFVWNALTE